VQQNDRNLGGCTVRGDLPNRERDARLARYLKVGTPDLRIRARGKCRERRKHGGKTGHYETHRTLLPSQMMEVEVVSAYDIFQAGFGYQLI
jgi:hypothetical protein